MDRAGEPKRLLQGAAVGAAVALALFAVEAASVMSTGAIGVNIDTSGPFAAVFAAIKPLLPSLIARVVLIYATGGALLGAAAALLSGAVETPRERRLLFVADLAALWVLLAWRTAVLRPALFDDVGFLRRPLTWLSIHGQPGHPLIALTALLLWHAWMARTRLVTWRPSWVVTGSLIAGALAYEAFSVAPEQPEKHPPLVVLIGIDAFRPDRLEAYGGKAHVAPHLDAFAKDAVLFDRAFTPIAQTEPAWRSLLTARWPTVTGVRYPLTAEDRWAPLPTFASQLAQSGWQTVFTTDCSRFNFQPENAGFTQRFQPPRGAINFALEKMRFRGIGLFATNAIGAQVLPEMVDNRALAGIHDPFGYAERLGDRLVQLAAKGPTLFSWHATAAHFPGDPSFPFYRARVAKDVALERRLRMVFTPIADGTKPAQGWSRGESEELYDELLGQADEQVGQLFDALKRAGRYDDALIIVFSDHGESFHDGFDKLSGATPVHGARLQEEENRVLLAVKTPGQAAHHVNDLVRLIDLGPTILDWAHVPSLGSADGQSALPAIQGKPLEPRLLFAETGYTHASPAAFDDEHLAVAPRTFDAYRVRPDGVIEMTALAHEGVLREKDFGAFDGEHWLVRAPLADGKMRETCAGNCEALSAFLDKVLGHRAPAEQAGAP